MGKNSDFYKKKYDDQIDKFNELSDTLPSFMYEYLKEIRNNRQPATVVAYCYDLVTFFEWLIESNPLYKDHKIKEIPLEAMEKLQARDFDEYKDYLRNKGGHNNSSTSIARKMTPLRGFYDHAVRYGDLKANPVSSEGIKLREDKSDIIRLTGKQVNDLKHAVKYSQVGSNHQQAYCEKTNNRDNAIIGLFLSTGIRVSECQGLDLDDLDFIEKRITVVRKGGKSSFIYLNDEICTLLLDYINGERSHLMQGYPDERALFVSNRHSRMCVKAIENVVKKYTKEVTGTDKYTPHKLRSTYGTGLYQVTGDIRLVADVLGHSSINTTAKHYAAVEEMHRKEAAKVDPYES